MNSLERNRLWSDGIIGRIDKDFRHRWEIYDDLIEAEAKKADLWLDLGCGSNEHIERFGQKNGIGIDLLFNGKMDRFVCADIRKLPLRDNSVGLITMRYVVEHIKEIDETFLELERVLKPRGRVVILTTNRRNPIISIASLLPFRLKQSLIHRIFKVEHDDIMKTYHKLNTPRRFRKGFDGFALVSIEYISDLNYASRLFFLIYLCQHILSMPLKKARSNILAVYEKSGIARKEVL